MNFLNSEPITTCNDYQGNQDRPNFNTCTYVGASNGVWLNLSYLGGSGLEGVHNLEMARISEKHT